MRLRLESRQPKLASLSTLRCWEIISRAILPNATQKEGERVVRGVFGVAPSRLADKRAEKKARLGELGSPQLAGPPADEAT